MPGGGRAIFKIRLCGLAALRGDPPAHCDRDLRFFAPLRDFEKRVTPARRHATNLSRSAELD
jgi:hypothetical protein